MSETTSKKLQETWTPNYIDLIGNTPVAEIQQMSPNPKVRIFAKPEGFNPGGSVKDRICKSMIEASRSEALLGTKLYIPRKLQNVGREKYGNQIWDLIQKGWIWNGY